MPKNFNKSTKTRSRFSTLISSNDISSSSKRSSLVNLTISSKRRKGKAPERATEVSSSSIVENGPEIPIEVPIDFLHSCLEDFAQKLDIIFKQNSKIIKKIEKLSTTQDNLVEHVTNLEEMIENMNKSSSRANDKPFINVI